MIFNLFLEFMALLLSLSCLGLIYFAIHECTESEFVPLYYFIALGATGILGLSLIRIEYMLFGNGFVLSSQMLQDLMISYIALFIFGTIWQSYEAEMAVPSFVDRE